MTRASLRAGVMALLAIATLVLPTTPAASDAAPMSVLVEDVVTGLEAPWEVAFTPAGAYFTERDRGTVSLLDADGNVSVVRRFPVDPASEGGLLGIAASPNYDVDGTLYVYLTTRRQNLVLSFQPAAPRSARVVIRGIEASFIHNGGRIAFGPDGKLYVLTGDADQPELSQDPDSLNGKILRVNPDGSVPDDNPMRRSAVWAMGLRNPQGIGWDANGVLFISEFGPDRDDEINVGLPGANYGWPEVTGVADDPRFDDPIIVKQPPEASWSGLVIPQDSLLPEFDGHLLAAALRGERLWDFELDGTDPVSESTVLDDLGRLRTAVQAPDGSIWILTSNRDGRGDPSPGDDRIVRLTPAP